MNMHNFSTGAAYNGRQLHPLTLEEIRHAAPSAFATEAHESRSSRYTYIPTSQVIAGLMREGFQPFKASQSHTRVPGKADFTKHMIRFRHMSSMDTLRVGDTVPEVVLINSHDGTSSYQLLEGLFRLVCSNGLIVPDGIVQSLKVYHKGNIVDEVVEGSFQIIQQSQVVLDRVKEFQQLQLTAGERTAFAETAREYRFADNEGKVATPISATQLLAPRRAEDVGDDLWRVGNRVQEHVIKGGLRGTKVVTNPDNGRHISRRITTRPVTGIDQDVRLNRAIFALMERMAQLKTAA